MGSTFSEVNMNRLLVFLCALTSTLDLPKVKDECQNCQQGVEKLFGNYVSQEGLAYQKEILYSICSDPIFDQVDCEIDIDLYWPKIASIIYSPYVGTNTHLNFSSGERLTKFGWSAC